MKKLVRHSKKLTKLHDAMIALARDNDMYDWDWHKQCDFWEGYDYRVGEIDIDKLFAVINKAHASHPRTDDLGTGSDGKFVWFIPNEDDDLIIYVGSEAEVEKQIRERTKKLEDEIVSYAEDEKLWQEEQKERRITNIKSQIRDLTKELKEIEGK